MQNQCSIDNYPKESTIDDRPGFFDTASSWPAPAARDINEPTATVKQLAGVDIGDRTGCIDKCPSSRRGELVTSAARTDVQLNAWLAELYVTGRIRTGVIARKHSRARAKSTKVTGTGDAPPTLDGCGEDGTPAPEQSIAGAGQQLVAASSFVVVSSGSFACCRCRRGRCL